MTRSPATRAVLVLTVAAAVFCGVVLLGHSNGAVGGSDSAGYANTARDIAAGRIVVPIEGLSRLDLDAGWAPVFIPLAHEPGPTPGTMVPFYPPGFPLHLALAAAVTGWPAALSAASPIAALLCLCLTFVLGRELGLSRPLSAAGAAILGGWVIFLFHAVHPMSDVTAALWTTASFVAALKARRRAGWAAAAGAAFGIAVLVRPTNGLLVLPLAFALPWEPRVFALFVAGGLPCAGFEAAWNRAAFGSALKTGYSHLFAGEFAFANFGARFAHYGEELAMELSPLVPLGWLAAGADRRVPARDRVVLVLWFAAVFLFYCFWGPADSWTYGRYMLPAAPPLVVGFLLSLRALSERIVLPARRVAAVGAALAVVFLCERLAERRRHPLEAPRGSLVFPDACRAVGERARGAVPLVVSMEFSAALRYYTDAVPVRWDWITPDQFALLRARAAQRGLPVYAVLLPHEVPQALPHVPGPWVFLGNVRQAALWELPPP